MRILKLLVTFLFFCAFSPGQAQYFYSVGGGVDMDCDGVTAMYSFNSNLIVGGVFSTAAAGTIPTLGIIKWDGNNWITFPVNQGGVNTITSYNGDLYIGGFFGDIGGNKYCSRIGHWDGTQWLALGKGITNGYLASSAVYNGNLFVGGQFTVVDSTITANRIARWDGNQWHAMGTGFTGGITNVEAMAVYNNELIVGGQFSSINGLQVSCICRWNGTSWDSLASGLSFDVKSLLVDTVNNLLYAGGLFNSSGSTLLPSGIAVWNGVNWAPVGGPPYLGSFGLKFYHGKLYNIGTQNGIVNMLGDTIDYISYFDGVNWRPPFRIVAGAAQAIEVYNDELYVGGYFDYVEDSLVRHIVRYYDPPQGLPDYTYTSTHINVFPNPANDYINIQYPGQSRKMKISFYKLTSSKAFQEIILGRSNSTVATNKFESGCYIYRICDNDYIVKQGKLIIIH